MRKAFAGRLSATIESGALFWNAGALRPLPIAKVVPAEWLQAKGDATFIFRARPFSRR